MKLNEKEFLDVELQMGICYLNEDFKNLAHQTADYVKSHNPKLVIDYGCGTGAYSQAMFEKGLNVMAQDVSKAHRDYVKANHSNVKVISKPVKADFMCFIEVAEHMTDEEIKTAISLIDPEKILFSSTPEYTDQDEEWNHINIKQENEWVFFWENLGYTLIDYPKTPTLWALMLKKI